MKAFFVLFLAIFSAAQTLPKPEPVGPNGPFVVTLKAEQAYSKAKSYDINSLVSYDGQHYVSMAGLNQGNLPGYASTLWLLVPKREDIALAAWGRATVGEPVMLGAKHFRARDTYTCAVTHELLAPPPQPEPPPPSRPGERPPSSLMPAPPPAHKATVTYRSGEQFTISEVSGPQVGYICAGN